jgi:hypothetical protein
MESPDPLHQLDLFGMLNAFPLALYVNSHHAGDSTESLALAGDPSLNMWQWCNTFSGMHKLSVFVQKS